MLKHWRRTSHYPPILLLTIDGQPCGHVQRDEGETEFAGVPAHGTTQFFRTERDARAYVETCARHPLVAAFPELAATKSKD